MNENNFDNSSTEINPLIHQEMRNKLSDPSFLPFYQELKPILDSINNDEEFFKWFHFINQENNCVYEILTQEYINELAFHLSQQVEDLGGTKQDPTVILEIGAGNGRLTHFLKQAMNIIVGEKAKLIACDSGEWNLETKFPVENISGQEALKKYKPKIVIFSWMPPYTDDLTADFRATPSVEQYYLIGSADDDCCGKRWETWGISNYHYNEDGERVLEHNEEKPYLADGFERTNLDNLHELQLSRLTILDRRNMTTTVEFKRYHKS